MNKEHFGDLKRLTPFSKNFGYERGGPIDWYYIEAGSFHFDLKEE